MQIIDGHLHLSATDLSNFISCPHLTQLDKGAARGEFTRPSQHDPYAAIVRELGLQHEREYVDYLRETEKKQLADLRAVQGDDQYERTLRAMRDGSEIIVQAALKNAHWKGYADILFRVEKKSTLGPWSYEVGDTKLAQKTKAGTVLQLCVYSDILGEVQGREPEYFSVIKRGALGAPEKFRYQHYAAYYRYMQKRLLEAISGDSTVTYPNPVAHCEVCQWFSVCDKRRRADDHLSFVAGMHPHHVEELRSRNVHKLGQFAERDKALDSRPAKGSPETYQRLHRQAGMQYQGRLQKKPLYQFIQTEVGEGLSRLPKPSAGDIFFDIEGDRFYPDGGLEYLLGIAFRENGKMQYKCWWSLKRQEEKRAFPQLMDFIMARLKEYPDLHIYHFANYEQSALKHLMLRHSTCGEELDWILRAERMVDLHAIAKQSMVASVEKYGLKEFEPFFNFNRKTPLQEARKALIQIQRSLELNMSGGITPEAKEVVRAYNAEDCYATEALRDWLEQLREEYAREFSPLDRPPLKTGEAKEEQEEKNAYIAGLFEALTRDLPEDPEEYNDDQRALWLLAHLLEYFIREKKNFWWEYYDRREAEYEDLKEDRKAIMGLEFLEALPLVGRERTPRHRYRFPEQEVSLSEGDQLDDLTDENGDKVGTVAAIDMARGIIDIKKTGKTIDRHPHSVQVNDFVNPKPIEEALHDFAEDVINNGLQGESVTGPARDLLMKRAPRIRQHTGPIRRPGEESKAAAIRSCMHLENSVLPIQGPPGCGKTYTGAHMILELVQQGKRIGVTALSHKAIDNMLERIHEEAGGSVQLAHMGNAPEVDPPAGISYVKKDKALQAAQDGVVVGATAFHWASEDTIDTLDYLFIDEAGQMSLAYVLAISRCCKNLIMLGDPQQLQQPQKAAHPEGTDVSALSHYLDGKQTIDPEKGLFLDTTWRLHPAICDFTSELYYDNRVHPNDGLEKQLLTGDHPFAGAGLFYVPVPHSGNRNQSDEEIHIIQRIVRALLKGNSRWLKVLGSKRKDLALKPKHIMVVAPYNAQVAALQRALGSDIAVGTVDKFQGREAAVVIYSMSSSSVDEAPRGMSFLFEPNRLNVASSRARCAFILVGSPGLFEVECGTPKQMAWANGLCRFREMAHEMDIGTIST